jgi:hypothetical protein
MNLDEAITALWLTKSHWPNFTVLSGEKQALQAGAWLDVLSDIEFADVRVALTRLDTEGLEFPPTPGQIRSSVLASRGLTAPDFDEALTEVLDSLRRYGSSPASWSLSTHRPKERPEPSHPAIAEAVKAMGGWSTIGQSSMGESWRAQFRNAYEAAAKRADREVMAPPIVRELAGQVAETLALPVGEEAS